MFHVEHGWRGMVASAFGSPRSEPQRPARSSTWSIVEGPPQGQWSRREGASMFHVEHRRTSAPAGTLCCWAGVLHCDVPRGTSVGGPPPIGVSRWLGLLPCSTWNIPRTDQVGTSGRHGSKLALLRSTWNTTATDYLSLCYAPFAPSLDPLDPKPRPLESHNPMSHKVFSKPTGPAIRR